MVIISEDPYKAIHPHTCAMAIHDEFCSYLAELKRIGRKNLKRQINSGIKRKCAACSSTNDLTVDHIVPRRLGGDNEYTNLQILCRTCNSRKGTKIYA